MGKNLPAIWKTCIWSLGWEDPLEKGMVTHSSVLAWRIPWTEEPSWLQSVGLQRVGHNWATFTHSGNNFGKVTDFIFLGSKVTADGDCSHEIKRCLLLGSKAMTSLDSILKSRDITLLIKVRLVKAMFFPVVMYGCNSWTIKKASTEQLMLLSCNGEVSWESLDLQRDQTSQSQRKSVPNIL